MARQADRDRVLLDATLMDDLPAMQRALTAGADVSARDSRGRTAFLSHRWPLLAERGSDINAQDADGETALMKAVMGGDPQDVAQVLALGADPNVRDRGGRTALAIATSLGLVAIVERLKKDTQP